MEVQLQHMVELTTICEALCAGIPTTTTSKTSDLAGVLTCPCTISLDECVKVESGKTHLPRLVGWLNAQLAVQGCTHWETLLHPAPGVVVADVDREPLMRLVLFLLDHWRALEALHTPLLKVLIVLSFSTANAEAMLACGRDLVQVWCKDFSFEDLELKGREESVFSTSGPHLHFASLVLVWVGQLLRVQLGGIDDALGYQNSSAFETRSHTTGPNAKAVDHFNARQHDACVSNTIRAQFKAHAPHSEMSLMFVASRIVTLAARQATVSNALFFLRLYAKVDVEHACSMSIVFSLSQRALGCLREVEGEEGEEEKWLVPVALILRFALSALHESMEHATACRPATLAPTFQPAGLLVVECGMVVPVLQCLVRFGAALAQDGRVSLALADAGGLAVQCVALMRGVEGVMDIMVKWQASVVALGQVLEHTSDSHLARSVLATMGVLFTRPAFKLEHNEVPRPSKVAPATTLIKWARSALHASLSGVGALVSSDAHSLHADLILIHVLQVVWTHLHALEDAALFIRADGVSLCFGLLLHPWIRLSELALTVATRLMKRFPGLIPAVVDELRVRKVAPSDDPACRFWLNVTSVQRKKERSGFPWPTLASVVHDCRVAFLQVYVTSTTKAQLHSSFVDFKTADNQRLGGVDSQHHVTTRARKAVSSSPLIEQQQQQHRDANDGDVLPTHRVTARYADRRTKFSFKLLLLLCEDARARAEVDRQSNFKRNRLCDVLWTWQRLERGDCEAKRTRLFSQARELPVQLQSTRLARCNLASCSISESYLKQFRQCNFCAKVVYCSSEHKNRDKKIHFYYCRKERGKSAAFQGDDVKHSRVQQPSRWT